MPGKLIEHRFSIQHHWLTCWNVGFGEKHFTLITPAEDEHCLFQIDPMRSIRIQKHLKLTVACGYLQEVAAQLTD